MTPRQPIGKQQGKWAPTGSHPFFLLVGWEYIIYDRLERIPAAPGLMALLLGGSCAVFQELATPVVMPEAMFTATNWIADGRVLLEIIIYNSEKNCELFYFSRFFLLFIVNFKGTVSLVWVYLKVISYKSPWYGHMAADIKCFF